MHNKHRNDSWIHKANLTLLITIPHSLPETPVSTISSLQQPDLLLSSPAHGSSSQNKSTYSSHLSASQSSVIVSISQIQFLFFHCHWTHFCYNLLINSTTHQTNWSTISWDLHGAHQIQKIASESRKQPCTAHHCIHSWSKSPVSRTTTLQQDLPLSSPAHIPNLETSPHIDHISTGHPVPSSFIISHQSINQSGCHWTHFHCNLLICPTKHQTHWSTISPTTTIMFSCNAFLKS